MSLRLQLLAVGALTLLLPWVGLMMVKEVETVLRTSLERSLLDTARARVVATELADTAALRPSSAMGSGISHSIYAHLLARPPVVDGFRSDWSFVRDLGDAAADSRAVNLGEGSRLWLGVNGIHLFVFVEIDDDEVVYQGVPGEPPHGDRIAIAIGADPADRAVLLMANAAAGTFRAQPSAGAPLFIPAGGYVENVYGAWADTATGFAIEARLPLRSVAGAVGIGVIDSDNGGASAELRAATWDSSGAPNALVRESVELNRILSRFAGGDDRIRILDPDGWVLADSGPLSAGQLSIETDDPSLLDRIFRYLLRRDDPDYRAHESEPGRVGDPALRQALAGGEAAAWFRRGADVDAVVAVAIPIDGDSPGKGAVILEQATDPILTATNRAMMRVIGTSGMIIVVATLGLLAFASVLSLRVGRLAHAAATALGPRGEINAKLPGMRSGDELGELSRAFADLLGRLRDYTEYLQSLKSTLTHELRTPLTIVATSVDNLEHELDTAPGRAYLERLRHGASRLELMLQAMTAATRVEQAITATERERFELGPIVSACVLAYADVYAGRPITLTLPSIAAWVEGSPELIEQLLDKLVDNAVGFAEPTSSIDISLAVDEQEVRLDVVNRGPLLPAAMRHRLFDSLVSVRERGGDKPHLGLGLYIVMLVAEFHGGKVEADNLADGSGVRIRVVLPCVNAGAA